MSNDGHDHNEAGHCCGGEGHDHHGDAVGRHGRSALLVELREHVPFSVSGVAIGLVVAGAICILGSSLPQQAASDRNGSSGAAVHDHAEVHDHAHGADQESAGAGSDGHDHDHGPVFARRFFHLFHPVHMLFSAAATAAMFCRYERKILKGVVVGLIGAVGVCGFSDIVMPQLSLTFLGVETEWHICVIEEPWLVLPFAFVGVLIGVATAGQGLHTTIYSHSLHVLASTMASIFYMVGPLGLTGWIDILGKVFLFIVVAVMVPCCLSDIVFPLFMSGGAREQYAREPHTH